MITVEKAEKIIQSKKGIFGVENILLFQTLGKVLAEDIFTDRDFPPFNRATVDGVAIKFDTFKKGVRAYTIKAVQTAGQTPISIESEDECIEIMTGSALSPTVDTVIRYEDIKIKDGVATTQIDQITKGSNIHRKGIDTKKGEIIVKAKQYITPSIIGVCASVGKEKILVKKLPKIVIISTGDELVDINITPSPYQLRRSNDVTIFSVLQRFKIHSDIVHIKDDYKKILSTLGQCLHKYDVILLTGGVSMGKFDYIPQALTKLSVTQHFHKIKQRPGKPFWFGTHPHGTTVFAFPGNPVSTFMCLNRYFVPWLETSLDLNPRLPTFAILKNNVSFDTPLQYFMQVKLTVDSKGQLLAHPLEGNGSGDFSNLVMADAFMELPLLKNKFKNGEAYKVWPFNDKFLT